MVMTSARQPLGRLLLGSLALVGSIVALGSLASGAGVAGSDPYSMQAQALLSSTQTDVTLRVEGPVRPAGLQKGQIKAWPAGAEEAVTRNFFDVKSPGGGATLHLTGRGRGGRLRMRAHGTGGPQHNVE